MQFLTLVEDSEEDEHTEEVDRLYACVDDDSESSSSSEESKGSKGDKKKDKKKKDKKKKVYDLIMSLLYGETT